MDSSVLRRRTAHALGGLLALTFCAGSMQAANALLATPVVSGAVTCATLTGPAAPITITVHAATAIAGTSTTQIVVNAPSAPGNGVSISPATGTLSKTAATVVFTVSALPGCAGLVQAATPSVQFQTSQTGTAGTVSLANDTSATLLPNVLDKSATALVAAPVTVTCGYGLVSGTPTWVPGSAQTVSVTSAASGGTPFTVDTTLANDPVTIVMNPLSQSGVATANPVNFTVAAAAGCSAFTSGSHTLATLHLLSASTVDQTVVVTIKIVPLSPLSLAPLPISLSFIKSSGNAATAQETLFSSASTSTASTFFTVSNLPTWLTTDSTSGYVPVNTGKALRFSTTAPTDQLAPGTYSATVYLSVSGMADYPVKVTLLVTNKPPTLSLTSANPMAVSYTLGSSTPPVTNITLTSTDSPIPYSITTGGVLAPQLVGQSTGIAYSFGSTIGVTYNPVLFSTSAPGTVLTGTVTITWGSPASVIVVTINLTVGSAGALVTGISPGTLPTALPGAPGTPFYVTLSGSGFVASPNPALATRVGIVTGSNPATLTPDSNVTIFAVNNSSNITLKIVVPTTTDANLPFSPSGAGGFVSLGVVNGLSTTPTGIAPLLMIGSQPIINGVTSSSSFTEVSGAPSLAPYDMISIFGSNFCSSQTTFPAPVGLNGGCSSNTILPGVLDANLRFPFSLSPDALITPTPPAAASWRKLSVTFYPHGTLSSGLPAPLLFGTNGQINTIVPGGVVTTPGTQYDIVVSFGCGTCTPSTVVSSIPFAVNTVPYDPGIFTVGSDGQGPAAALASPSYALINNLNPAGMRTTAGNSDVIQLYVTGLGAPDSAALFNAGSGSVAALGSTGYLGALNASVTPNLTFTNIDGDVLQSALYPGEQAPSLIASPPTATIGGVSAPVQYAGFVADTIAGLYQVNVQLPPRFTSGSPLYPNYPLLTNPITTLNAPTQLPIVLTFGSGASAVSSQAGVMLSVAPRLYLTAPSSPWTATVGVTLDNTITADAAQGTAPFKYAVTSGVLPAGLVLNPATGEIVGKPAAGTGGINAAITVTATDSANIPLTGTYSFVINVAGGLYMTLSGSATPSTFGTLNNSASQIVTPTGGVYPYTFAVTVSLPSTGSPAPVGMTAIPAGGIGSAPYLSGSSAKVGISALTYHVTITATDASGNVSGSTTFDVVVGLKLSLSPVSPITFSDADTADAITTVTVAGGSSTYTYTIDAASAANALSGGLTFTGGGLYVGSATTGAGMTVIIDVVDSGSPPTGGIVTVAPAQITLTLTLN